MKSTGVLNLVIGLTGVKEIHGARLSYMSLARAAVSLPSLSHPRPSISNRRRALTRSRATARLQDHRRRSATAHVPPCAIRAAAQRSPTAAARSLQPLALHPRATVPLVRLRQRRQRCPHRP